MTPPLELTLAEATAAGSAAPGRRTPFSLVFVSAAGTPVLPQRIYTLYHATLGDFDLFLVPISADQRGVRYEAIFT